ncbi:ribonuclease HIII [bacterium]|nr:ribonuclease HIII [bacterium]
MDITDFTGEIRAGIDESGKGDVFGPIIIAGAIVLPEQEEMLKENKIRDSKMISPNVIKKLALILKKELITSVVMIGPEKYNQLYSKMGNMNLILGWGHKTVISNLLEQRRFPYAISDRFSKKERIDVSALDVQLYQFEKGEREVSVAAASILARAAFLDSMDRMSAKFDMEFPKGAGPQVNDALLNFTSKHSLEQLHQVAKINFKNVKNIWS